MADIFTALFGTIMFGALTVWLLWDPQRQQGRHLAAMRAGLFLGERNPFKRFIQSRWYIAYLWCIGLFTASATVICLISLARGIMRAWAGDS